MKKVFLFAALTGLFLASCSNDEFFGSTENKSTTNEIGFGMNVPNLTRATTGGAAAAQKLNNNFVVYGFKCEGDEQPDGTKQQTVFGRYNVNYIGSAGTTQSNTKGWEYVGYTSIEKELQTMKYWDYSAKSYVFSAISCVGIKPEKTTTGTTVYDKGWTVTIPAGGSISALYASERKPVTKTEEGGVYKYPETVNLTFYAMGTKVRFGVYETVPGYEVHIDKFYCMDETGAFSSESNTTTNFGINGKFLTPYADEDTKLTVTYYDAASGIENRPKVNFTPDPAKLDKLHSAKFGTNMQAQPKIGETSVTATYDKAGGEYSFILPYKNTENFLQLYVDFTLKAPNGETIKVYQAKATVPAAYTQWKENFAYTYLFKISDNTNGTTGTPSDPDDPTKPWDPTKPHDPEGLYSITFDACIVDAEAGLTEDGIQEVISSVATPSITTYAKGKVVTDNNEYEAGTVYYSAKTMDCSVTPAVLKHISTENSAVYEIVYSGTSAITEGFVANYAKGNGVLLVPVATKAETSAPLSDGSKLTFGTNECKSFNAAAGKNYAIVYTVDGVETFKVVRVAGTPATTVTYSVALPGSQTIAATDEYAVFKLINSDATYGVKGANILGAATFFNVLDATSADVTENFTITADPTDGYRIAPTAAAVAAGSANGTYTVEYGTASSTSFTVNILYTIEYTTGSTATVIADNTNDIVTLKVTSTNKPTTTASPYSGAKIVNTNTGITVTDNKNGTYTIAADATATTGAQTITIAGQTVSVTVDSYSFNPNEKTITWPEGTDKNDLEKVSLQLQKNGTAITSVTDNFTSTTPSVIADGVINSGVVTASVLDAGTTTLKYKNAECKVTVNKYELKSSTASIDKATGSTKLTYWINGKQQNAAPEAVTVKKLTNPSPETWQVKTDGFSLTSDGRDLTFGNVAVDGTYKIEYYDKDGKTVLGFEVITVNPQP